MSTESRDTRGLLGKLFGKGSAAALLLAVFLISGTAWAVDYKVFGIGTQSCGGWTAAKKMKSYPFDYQTWITGYLTAYSRWAEEGLGPVGNSDANGAWAWIDNYCRDNPLEDVADAAEALILAITVKSLKAK